MGYSMYFHTINLWYGSCAIQNKEIKMKSLSLKVMTLLMAALVLSASGCFNENEMSSPEGTVKGFLKALDNTNLKKMQSYLGPYMVLDKNTFQLWHENCYSDLLEEKAGGPIDPYMLSGWIQIVSPTLVGSLSISNVKTTLVSEIVGQVWKDNEWHPQKQATVKSSYKRTITAEKVILFDNRQDTVKLMKLDNKWYIERWPGF